MLDMPGWATGLGWILALNSLMFVIVFAIIAVVNTYRHENSGFEHLGLAKVRLQLLVYHKNGTCMVMQTTLHGQLLNFN